MTSSAHNRARVPRGLCLFINGLQRHIAGPKIRVSTVQFRPPGTTAQVNNNFDKKLMANTWSGFEGANARHDNHDPGIRDIIFFAIFFEIEANLRVGGNVHLPLDNCVPDTGVAPYRRVREHD